MENNWKDSLHLKKEIPKLSSELRDLLDKILVTKPEERYTVENIKQHNWYRRTLAPKYQAALDRIEDQQRHLDEHVSRQQSNVVSSHLLLSPHLKVPNLYGLLCDNIVGRRFRECPSPGSSNQVKVQRF